MDSYQLLCAMRRRANQQLDQRRYDALHEAATREWEAWLVQQLADGLPRYSPQGKRLSWPWPPEQLSQQMEDCDATDYHYHA